MNTSPAPNTSSPTSSAASRELREKVFGPLLDIGDESILSLALKVRNQVSSEPYESSPDLKPQVLSHLHGSYNLVFIVDFGDGLKYVVRMPGIGWGDRWTDLAIKSFESQIMIMRLIHNETSIPVPEVYAYDASQTNELGAPWMVMSFILGSTAGKLWFDNTGPTPLEERRQRSLETLAEAMSQLQKFQFSRIGSPESTESCKKHNKITIGPIYYSDFNDPEEEDYGKTKQIGPFDSSRSYMLHEFSPQKIDPLGWGRAAYQVNSIVLSHLPKSNHDLFSEDDPEAETFVLCHPDFDSQNILIDEKGNLTGLIDWDGVQTYPRFLGYCRYPSFLTPDWDPIMYGYPGCPRYLSPEELVRYRQIYSDRMIQMLHREGDAIFAEKSHIFEAVWIASCDPRNRTEIIKKIIKQALPEISPKYDEFYVVIHLAKDDFDELNNMTPDLMGKLETGIKKLLTVARPERNKVVRL